MSRSDLLIQLVKAGGNGDKQFFKKIVEAIIAEERAKQHTALAEKLQETLNSVNNSGSTKNHLVNGANRGIEGSNLLFEIKPSLGIDDLVLNQDTKSQIHEFIEEQARADLLRSYNIEPRNRILLIGAPGNGKTSLAEAIAGALMVPLLAVRYESIIASYLGETSVRLKNLFDYVKTQHCVLFFDEFDAIGKERGDIHETGEIKRVVSSLLLQIDKLPSYVIAVAATNHPELLDKAVWRRFQIRTELPKPTSKEIGIFVSNYQKKYGVNFGLASTNIGLQLRGLSFAEVQEFCDDVIRKYVLKLPNTPKTLKAISTQSLLRIKKSYKPRK